MPINFYPEYSRLPQEMPGRGLEQVWVQAIADDGTFGLGMCGFGEPVAVTGMEVASGDLVHADQHGAVVIPADVAGEVMAAADLIARREAVIIEAARQPGFDHRKLLDARRRSAEID